MVLNFSYNLKEAFKEARSKGNMALAIPALLSSQFYVVGIDMSAQGEWFEFALTKSPKEGELCVTASENPARVTFKEWDVAEFHGRELLQKTPQNAGVLIAYESGGDYLSREQIDHFLSLLDKPS